jgi:hypothetical protein
MALGDRLEHLGPGVMSQEAQTASKTAHAGALQLADEYRVIHPAILHNILVNLGWRKRGLCYQWADDLTARLEVLKLQTLKLHRGAARLGSRREHSAVVLTAVDQPFEQGIVLDAWRHGGRLFWSAVKADKYPWQEVEVDEGNPQPITSANAAKAAP